MVATISLDHCYSAVQGTVRNVDSAMSSELDSSDSTTPQPGRCLSPKRRSQRQIDKIELEQLRKIRAENEELLKKEKEVMNNGNTPKSTSVVIKKEVTVLHVMLCSILSAALWYLYESAVILHCNVVNVIEIIASFSSIIFI